MMTENYIKVTRSIYFGTTQPIEYVVGIQYFENDNFEKLQTDVKLFMEVCIIEFKSFPQNNISEYALTIRDAAKGLYPGRRVFIEVGDDTDSWVQICHREDSVTN